jgi:CheY-like chemotaxis protein
MDAEDLSKLFQRFSQVGSVPLRLSSEQAFAHTLPQVNRRVSSEYGGSGLGGFQSSPSNSSVTNIGTSRLGLNISRELVRLLNGNLTVSSEKDVGSTFSFSAEYGLPSTEEIDQWHKQHSCTLPGSLSAGIMADLQDDAALDDIDADQAPRFTHIMAAEDNALNRRILHRFLRDRETVALSSDGQEAVDYFASPAGGNVQLIVMDCEMPRLDGRKATRKIREIEEERMAEGGPSLRVPIIGLSGNARPEQIAQAKEVSWVAWHSTQKDTILTLHLFQCGMDDYLSKPCSKQTLEDMIRKWEKIVHARHKLEQSE